MTLPLRSSTLPRVLATMGANDSIRSLTTAASGPGPIAPSTKATGLESVTAITEHTFPGVPSAVAEKLRGEAGTVARQGYFKSLTSPQVGSAFSQNPNYARTFGTHPSHRTQPLPPGSVDIGRFLTQISDHNDRQLQTHLATLQAALPPPEAARLQALQARLLETPLQLKHFAEPGAYACHEIGQRRYVHLVSDTQKTAAGQSGAKGQSMDASLFNLEDFVYFSVEPQACGAAGKATSRFGAVQHAVPLNAIASQLPGASLFTCDFATRPRETDLALFRSPQGSTGDDALDETLRAHGAGGAARALSDEELGRAALAATDHHAHTGHGLRPISRALSVYRYAGQPEHIHAQLALAVTHQTALVKTLCHRRLQELEAAGSSGSPASRVLTQLVDRIDQALSRPDKPSNLNFLMNRIGVRPQLVVPSSVVLPA